MDRARVTAQLHKLLASPQFAQSGRLSRFLRLAVEAGQKNDGDSLKEYRVGVDVFDRGKDFDPRIDPIVRVQAAKLRSKLAEYYAGEGARDLIVITIPKGSYAPDIRERGAEPSIETQAPAQPALEKSRIAVLPFVNMSADPESEYFSDGLTEELINRLASVPSLQVVARTSAFRFKGRSEDIRNVGLQLNAGTVVEGSVRRAGDQVRITAQLIDVQSGYHIFSRTYQREYKGIFALQDELAQAVADEIVPQDAPGGQAVAKSQAPHLEAYSLYLRGMFALSNRFGNWLPCVDLFRQALQIDPAYAAAWAGLAHTYLLMSWFNLMPA